MTHDDILDALRALLETDPRTLHSDLLWRLEADCHLASQRLREEMRDRTERSTGPSRTEPQTISPTTERRTR